MEKDLPTCHQPVSKRRTPTPTCVVNKIRGAFPKDDAWRRLCQIQRRSRGIHSLKLALWYYIAKCIKYYRSVFFYIYADGAADVPPSKRWKLYEMKWLCFRPLLCTLLRLNWAKQTPGKLYEVQNINQNVSILIKKSTKSHSSKKPTNPDLVPPFDAIHYHSISSTSRFGATIPRNTLSQYIINIPIWCHHSTQYIITVYHQHPDLVPPFHAIHYHSISSTSRFGATIPRNTLSQYITNVFHTRCWHKHVKREWPYGFKNI